MAVTPTSLKALFPEFGVQSDPRVQLFIDMASRRVDATAFGALFDDAVSYLSAHLLSEAIVAQLSGGKGKIISESAGPVSRSYALTAGATGYATTAYGAEFLKLRRAACLTPMAC